MKRCLLALALLTGCADGPADAPEDSAAAPVVRAESTAPAAPKPTPDPDAPRARIAPIDKAVARAVIEPAPMDGGVAAAVAPSDVPAPEPAPKAEDEAEPAASLDSLKPLLLARHTRDLPTKAQLDSIRGAQAGLEALAGDDSQLVATRALMLLGHYPGTEGRLIGVAEDKAQPRKLRAGALQGLARRDLSADADLRGRVEQLLLDPEVPVAFQAASVLGPVPEARSALVAASKNDALPSQVQMAARRALGQ
jgi:hypothetical protein